MIKGAKNRITVALVAELTLVQAAISWSPTTKRLCVFVYQGRLRDVVQVKDALRWTLTAERLGMFV